MLLDDILAGVGPPHKETCFLKPPKETYLVWFDDVTRRGADDRNMVADHAVTFELYAYKPDPGAEKGVEKALDAACVEWQKTARQWVQSEQLYMTIYYFDYIEKE